MSHDVYWNLGIQVWCMNSQKHIADFFDQNKHNFVRFRYWHWTLSWYSLHRYHVIYNLITTCSLLFLDGFKSSILIEPNTSLLLSLHYIPVYDIIIWFLNHTHTSATFHQVTNAHFRWLTIHRTSQASPLLCYIRSFGMVIFPVVAVLVSSCVHNFGIRKG